MTSKAIDGVARAVAAAGLLSTLAVGTPAAAAQWMLAQAPPASATATPAPVTPGGGTAAAPGPHRPAELSEARIEELRTKLQITPAEQPQFNAVAEVMRANAQTMEALLAEREADPQHTAVTALRWYERLTVAHGEALQKFVPAFETLYGALSDSQRQTADAMFQQFAERPFPHKPK